MSLITKYRPNTFEGIAGNQDAIAQIKVLLDKKPPKHTFLLSGNLGCGKTTLGRAIAKYVGCNIDIDFMEVDAAALNGVGPARELREKCQYRSLGAGPRVWLIDECHRMTEPAQEILLKTFEEPPDHAYFILATTDPQKLKKTLVDRFAHFKLSPLNENDFKKFIKKIIRRENATIPDNIVEMLFDKSEGRPRTALNLLEKIIGLTEDQMVASMSQIKDAEGEIIDVCRSMLKGESWSVISKILKPVIEKEDPETIRRVIYGYMTSVILKSENQKAFEIASNFKDPFYTNGKSDVIFCCYNALH